MDIVLSALDTLKDSIQYKPDKTPRLNVRRKETKASIEQLGRILERAGIQPITPDQSSPEDCSRIRDPYWYLDTLVLLADCVTGAEGVKRLAETIVIIKVLLKEIQGLEAKLAVAELNNDLRNFAESSAALGRNDDNASIASGDQRKEVLKNFLNGNALGNRTDALVHIRQDLEQFLMSEGYCGRPLFNMASLYNIKENERDARIWENLKMIMYHGNDAAHLATFCKETWVTEVRGAVEGIPAFKVFLQKQLVN